MDYTTHIPRKDMLAEEYISLVGYDPFSDDPAITCDDVADMLADLRRLHAQAARGDM